ncbi:hypothetical protein NUW58_g7090 [Xylaria curta]|uniref:Uncharacterized protein n=1 Tax=Xylaria curta TaxID=42375 RepID=A0ACC1NKM9_9PEZI|nr:hypothetical protein NUW58_g7090 [Xylaria curta]
MPESADLRIASKRAYYDNCKENNDHEIITLYIYNAGPSLAATPVVRAGFSYSMDYNAVITTLRQAKVWHSPSERIKAGNLSWTKVSNIASHYEDWDMVTTLPNVPAGMLMELSLSFLSFRGPTFRDYTLRASVSSATADPRTENNSTTYIVTPNHHDDGPNYWDIPGNLANLDFEKLVAIPLLRGDLRIASKRRQCHNNKEGMEPVSYDIIKKALKPKLANSIEYGHFSESLPLTFSSDENTQLFLYARPDTLLYLEHTTIVVGDKEAVLIFWIPLRIVWVGAVVRRMNPGGSLTGAYVIDVRQAGRT